MPKHVTTCITIYSHTRPGLDTSKQSFEHIYFNSWGSTMIELGILLMLTHITNHIQPVPNLKPLPSSHKNLQNSLGKNS